MPTSATCFYNAGCSKCRQTRDLLDAAGVDTSYVSYLDDAPSKDDLVAVMGKLGFDDPRQMMRTGESIYAELGLAAAGSDTLLDAMTTHPILIERPIVIVGDRAVIARPPERVHELLG